MKAEMEIEGKKIEIPKKLIRSISKSIAKEVAEQIYYKLLLLRYIPEIEAIKKGKIKTMTPEEFKRALLDE